MTTEVLGNNVPTKVLDQSILDLIQESGAGTGLEGLINFESKLSKEEKKSDSVRDYFYSQENDDRHPKSRFSFF